MRVLYVIPGLQNGASMLFSHNEIDLITGAGLNTKKLMLGAFGNFRQLKKRVMYLRMLEKEFVPNIIHAHYGSLTAFICSLVCRTPLIITYRGSDLNPSPSDGMLRSTLQKFFSNLAALRAAAIICVSKPLVKRLWWCHEKAVVIPSGVDLELFRTLPRAEARKHLDWRDEEKIVLFNAGYTPAVKRLDLAEASIKVVREVARGVRFIVLRGTINHKEIPFYLNGADCLLVTSDFEGSPTIVKEALACNLPVISVDVGDVAERLKGVSRSRIVARDPRIIGSAIAEILASGQRSNGREFISELSATTIRDRVLEVYFHVLNSRKCGGPVT